MDGHGSVAASRYARINQSSAERAGSLTVTAAAFPVQVGRGSVLFWILLWHNPYLLKRPDRVDPAIELMGFTGCVFEPLLKQVKRCWLGWLFGELGRVVLKHAPDGGGGNAMALCYRTKALPLAAIALDSGVI